MKIIVEAIQYNVHQWNMCGDLQVICTWIGMRGDFTNLCCFCRSTAEHYIQSDWGPRKNYEPGKNSVQHIPLVNPLKIFFPLLHIKLGLI